MVVLGLLITTNVCSVIQISQLPTYTTATIPVSPVPIDLAVTPDGKYIYVVNSSSNTVTVISATDYSKITTIDGFDLPYSVTINPAGTFAYVTNLGPNGGDTVSVIDLNTNTITDTITGFAQPDAIAITPDNKYAYVANLGTQFIVPNFPNAVVNVVDLSTNEITDAISVGQHTTSIAISPDGKYVYAINFNNGRDYNSSMSVIETTHNTVVATIFGFSQPYTLVISPDNKFAYVTNFSNFDSSQTGGSISVVDLETNQITNTITLVNQPTGIAITPDGNYLYVNNYNPSGVTGLATISIIKTFKYQILPTIINVGNAPATIAISQINSSRTTAAYVANSISNTVTAITVTQNTNRADLSDSIP